MPRSHIHKAGQKGSPSSVVHWKSIKCFSRLAIFEVSHHALWGSTQSSQVVVGGNMMRLSGELMLANSLQTPETGLSVCI